MTSQGQHQYGWAQTYLWWFQLVFTASRGWKYLLRHLFASTFVYKSVSNTHYLALIRSSKWRCVQDCFTLIWRTKLGVYKTVWLSNPKYKVEVCTRLTDGQRDALEMNSWLDTKLHFSLVQQPRYANWVRNCTNSHLLNGSMFYSQNVHLFLE